MWFILVIYRGFILSGYWFDAGQTEDTPKCDMEIEKISRETSNKSLL